MNSPSAPSPSHEPVRVMHVLAYDAAAGTELMTATLAERCAEYGIAPLVVTLDRPGVIAERLATAGVPVRSLGPGGSARVLARLAREVRRTRPDVICGYGFRTGIATRLLARVIRPRARTVTGVRGLYVTEIESLDSPRGRLVMAVERLSSTLVDAYVANSSGAIAVLAEHGIDERRLHLIPNGIDADAWPNPDRSVAATEDPPLVACVGRFTAVKRQIDIVEAAAVLRDRGIAARFVFAGSGPLLAAAQDRAAALGLRDEVEFRGALGREQLADLFARAELACLASSQEGMPGAVMEAMACSLPVVGTDVNGIRDLVLHGRTGLLVPPSRPAALAGALGELLLDPARRATLGAAGRRRIVDAFSLTEMVARTSALHREMDLTERDGRLAAR